MTTPIFNHVNPDIVEVTFSFRESVSVSKKLVYSIYSFLKQPILETCDQSGQAYFWPYQLLIFMNLYQHTKIWIFHPFVLEI